MVSFKVGAKTMRRWRPLLLNLDAKSTRQQDCCDLYYNKRWHHVYRPWSRPLLINVCQHTVDTDDGSPIQSTMVWLGRCHLAFAVANCVLNLRFSVATVGRCDDGWKLRRVAGEARNMTENALSILILIFSVQLQQTETSDRKLFIFHLGQASFCRKLSCRDVTYHFFNIQSLSSKNMQHKRRNMQKI